MNIKAIEVPSKYSPKERSRYLKTSLREYIIGDFLYVDTDTIFAECPPFYVSEADIAMVTEQYWQSSNGIAERIIPDYFFKKGKNVYERSGYERIELKCIFNGGVMWVRDTYLSHCFFKEWNEEWQRTLGSGIVFDQPSLNYLNKKHGYVIHELDGIWNCQVMRPIAQKYIDHAIILHYFNGRADGCVYLMSNDVVQKKGYQSEEVQLILADPKNAFLPFAYMPLDGATEEIMYCKAFSVLKNLYKRHLQIYRGINFVLSVPERICNLFHGAHHARCR